MTMPSNKWEEALDTILEEFGYAIVNHPEASRVSHIRTYKLALTNAVKELIETAKPDGTIKDYFAEGQNYELQDRPTDYIIGYEAALDTYQANLLKAIGDNRE